MSIAYSAKNVDLEKVFNGVNYVPFNMFKEKVQDRETFSQLVDKLLETRWTMAERSKAAEDAYSFYVELMPDKPSEFDMNRLYNWIRGNYQYEEFPIFTEEQLEYRREKVEVYAKKGDITYIIDREDKIKRKGGMIPYRCPWDVNDQE
jgi:hypothetical protein